MLPVIFAHGLEGSPDGTKATYLRETFRAAAPDLSELSLTDQARALIETAFLRNDPPVLVGSSLGGLAALEALVRNPASFSQAVLLAPAVGCWRLGQSFAQAERERPGLRDAVQAASELTVPENVPTTVIYGLEDEVVPRDDVIELVERSPSAQLLLVHDDHSLHGSRALIEAVVRRAVDGRAAI